MSILGVIIAVWLLNALYWTVVITLARAGKINWPAFLAGWLGYDAIKHFTKH